MKVLQIDADTYNNECLQEIVECDGLWPLMEKDITLCDPVLSDDAASYAKHVCDIFRNGGSRFEDESGSRSFTAVYSNHGSVFGTDMVTVSFDDSDDVLSRYNLTSIVLPEDSPKPQKKPETTDFQMLMALKDFCPRERGIISADEIGHIRTVLEIKGRDVLSLRNLRNFTVMFYGRDKEGEPHEETMRRADKMSAICAVIDEALFSLGAEV